MAEFVRYRPVLSGFVGGPGINTWHAEAVLGQGLIGDGVSEAFAASVRAVYQALRGYLVANTLVTFPGEATVHDEETGTLVRAIAFAPPEQVTSNASSTMSQTSRATQAVVRLNTGTVRDGRRLQGRHFIGPVSSDAIGTDGQLSLTARNEIAAAYGGVLDFVDGRLVVYGPPKLDDNDNVESVGKKATVTSVFVNPTPGSLRSRKV